MAFLERIDCGAISSHPQNSRLHRPPIVRANDSLTRWANGSGSECAGRESDMMQAQKRAQISPISQNSDHSNGTTELLARVLRGDVAASAPREFLDLPATQQES